MSVRQLLDRIEKMNVVEDRILKRIRRQIDDPEKNIKAKGILSFLVKKQQISKKQAAKLLKETQQAAAENGDAEPEKPNVYDSDELIGVAHPTTDEDNSDDVDDLISHMKPEPEPVEVESVEVEVESVEVEVEIEPVEIDVEPVEVETQSVEVEPFDEEDVEIDLDAETQPNHSVAPIADPIGMQQTIITSDPLSGFDDTLSAGLDAPQPPQKKTGEGKGFRSKKVNENQWSSKWLFIGPAVLGTILIMLTVLWVAVGRQNIEALKEEAQKSFDTGAYSDAIAKTEKLLELSPRHAEADKWKVNLVHYQLVQPFERQRYSEVLTIAEEHLEGVSELETFDELRKDLSQTILPTTAVALTSEAFANSTKLGATIEDIKSELAVAKRAEALLNNSAYMPSSARKMDLVAKQLDEIEDHVRGIESSITKETDFQAAQVEIRDLTENSKTDAAFLVFSNLTKNYPDLGTREELRSLMRNVSIKEAGLVIPAGLQLVGQQAEQDSRIEEQVVVARHTGTPINELVGQTIPVLTEGVLYGYDAGDGTVRWNRFMGFETHYFPQWSDEDNRDSLIVSDRKNHSIMKLDAASGAIIWRTEIGQPFANPCVTSEKIVVTTESGIVVGLENATGNTFASVQLPQKTSVAASASSRYPFFYQPGDYSNLYVLDANSLECMEVVYLGHSPGSLTVPVLDWSGYVAVLINQVDYCGLHLFKSSGGENVAPGLGLMKTQVLLRLTNGHVSTPLEKVGRARYLATSDTGFMSLLEMNKVENPDQPVSAIGQQNFQVRKGEKSFVNAKSNRLWIGSQGIERFRISAIGEFKREPIVEAGDYILGPMANYDDKLFHVRRRSDSAMSSASAVDVQTLQQIWRSDLGAAFAGAPRNVNGAIQVVSSQGDLFTIDESATQGGYTDRAVVSSEIVESLQFEDSVTFADGSYACIGSPDSKEFLMVQLDGTTSLERLQTPADTPACPIIAFKNSLLVASTKGQVVLVNPANGRTIGSPFQPRKTPEEKTEWRKPAVVTGDQIVVGKADGNVYLLRSDGRELSRVSELKLSGTLESGFVGIGSVAFGVSGEGAVSHLIRFETGEDGFRETGKIKLEGRPIAGPWEAGGMILLATDFGKLVATTSDINGEVAWSFDLGNETLACPPIVEGDRMLLAMRSGKLILLNGQTGDIQKEVEIGQPIMHAPLFTSDKIYIGSADGRLLILPGSTL